MTRHVIVDGSNLATEGRSLPSLAQLEAAVQSFMDDNPDDVITIVVDATFGHRIDNAEVARFEAGIEHNELVAPPAGAIGRGDAFVLAIANKVGATILSNDSFQEFHGVYDWLFDEGRLIGGKPVPNVGWVFVPRLPVRGPTSRKSVREATQKNARPARGSARPSKVASAPLPVPKSPPPGIAKHSAVSTTSDVAAPELAQSASAAVSKAPSHRRSSAPAQHPAEGAEVHADESSDRGTPARSKIDATNDLTSFFGFVEKHPIGSSVNAVVDTYSSHGAYVKIGDVVAYLPLRLMASPPPRSARDIVKIGDAITLAVSAYHAQRRSIELCIPALAPPAAPSPVVTSVDKAKPRKRATAKKGVAETAAAETTAAKEGVAEKANDVTTEVPATAGTPSPVATAPVDPAVASPSARARRSGRRLSTSAAAPVLTDQHHENVGDQSSAGAPFDSPSELPVARPTKRGGRKAAAVAPVPAVAPVAVAPVAAAPAVAPAARRPRNKKPADVVVIESVAPVASTLPPLPVAHQQPVDAQPSPVPPSRSPRKRAEKLPDAAERVPVASVDPPEPAPPAGKQASKRPSKKAAARTTETSSVEAVTAKATVESIGEPSAAIGAAPTLRPRRSRKQPSA